MEEIRRDRMCCHCSMSMMEGARFDILHFYADDGVLCYALLCTVV